MTLGLFDPEAILNILRSAYVAEQGSPGSDDYQRGFHTALVAVGLACGAFEVKPAEVTSATTGNLLFGVEFIEEGD